MPHGTTATGRPPLGLKHRGWCTPDPICRSPTEAILSQPIDCGNPLVLPPVLLSVLPRWLQPISYLIPLTCSLITARRRAILLGEGLSALTTDLLPLVLFTAALLPLSFVPFRYAVRRAKIEGSLTQY
jgi:hypothetical protein